MNMNTPALAFKVQLTEGAFFPLRASKGAAGYDLCAYLPGNKLNKKNITIDDTPENLLVLGHNERCLIPTGLSMSIPNGWYGRIAPRSGLAWKHGLDVMAGVIDSDYRGDIGVILVNLGSDNVEIKHGDRIAQIIFERCYPLTFLHEDGSHFPLDFQASNVRGENGFGSTGV